MIAPAARPQPLSSSDFALGALVAAALTAIWFVGDFHGLHNSDSIIHSLNSLYQWTIFVWEYDHIGSLVSLLTRFIARPYWNLLAVSTITSLLFLTGLALWVTRITSITFTEASLWTAFFLPIMLTQHATFQLGSHTVSSGIALFFSGWYVYFLQQRLSSDHNNLWLALLSLIAPAFLAIYLSKIVFFPMAAVTAGLLWVNRPLSWHRILLISGSHVLALLCYELLEWTSPYKKDYTLDLAILPVGLPRLLENWGTNAMSGILWLAAPALLLLCHSEGHRSVFPFLAAGTMSQVLVISSSRWAATNSFAAYYLFDLSVLSILAVIVLVATPVRHLHPQIRRGILLIAGLAAIVLNVLSWHAYHPSDPLSRIENKLGVNTLAFLTAQCDLIVGDYWTAWPAMLAVNDYYYRNHILDPGTQQTQRVYAITYLAASTEHLWRPILDHPNPRLCSLADDDAGYKRYLSLYTPEIALQTHPITHIGSVIVHRVHLMSLQSVTLDFDQLVPGIGWSFGETSPNGETFQWMENSTATILLPLAMDHDVQIKFRILYTMSPEILQGLTLLVNEQPIALSRSSDLVGGSIFIAHVPSVVVTNNPCLAVLTFRVSHTLIPQFVMTNSDDMRSLGLAFDWVRIESQP